MGNTCKCRPICRLFVSASSSHRPTNKLHGLISPKRAATTMSRMTSRSTSRLTSFLLSYLLLTAFSHTRPVSADNVTAKTDYGFGPLWISYDVEGEVLYRCNEITFDVGGGFAPYTLGEGRVIAMTFSNIRRTSKLKLKLSAMDISPCSRQT